MKNIKIVALLIPSLLATFSCSTSPNRSPAFSLAEGDVWSGKMRDLSKAMSKLLPLITSQASFDRSGNKGKITDLTTELTGLTHDISKAKFNPNQDPGVSGLAAQFESDIADAARNLKSGNRVSARARLQTATTYCISCHSMGTGVASVRALELHPDLSDSTEIDKAEYYASTRQFDQAMIHYEYALTNPALANATRVKKDSLEASPESRTPGIPAFRGTAAHPDFCAREVTLSARYTLGRILGNNGNVLHAELAA